MTYDVVSNGGTFEVTERNEVTGDWRVLWTVRSEGLANRVRDDLAQEQNDRLLKSVEMWSAYR